MNIPFIDLKTQYERIADEVQAGINAVLQHGQFILGPEVGIAEQALAEYVGVGHCVTVASGSDALLIALMALGIGKDDEVITTPFTFIATAEMIALLGARPVFVDIDPETYNLDPEKLEAAIGERTRAIIPVGLYGQCADMDAINAIAGRHGLPVIEDGAQSFGATCKGRQSCGLSTIGTTSFFPAKPLGCYGEGGACFTDDAALAERMRQIRVHGQNRRYNHALIGVNGRFDTLQAAVIIEKLRIFPDEVHARQAVADRYDAGLRGVVTTPRVLPDNTSVYAQYTIEVDGRDQVQQRLTEAGVPTAVHYPIPLSLQPAFADLGHAPGDFPVAEAKAARVMSLPMHPYLDAGTQDEIIAAVSTAVDPRS